MAQYCVGEREKKPTPAKKNKAQSVDDELAEFQKEAESRKELSDDSETTPIVPTEEDTGGRPDNGCFDFDPDHILYATHYQQLRSKQKIPLLIRLPPKNPSSKPEVLTDKWKKTARHFAQYYLTLFRPWTKVRFTNLN